MAAALPITPVTNPYDRFWLINDQLPMGEVVFVDGLTGVGKSSTAAHYASHVSRAMIEEHPAAVLYFSSYAQQKARDYHLTIHQANFEHIRCIEVDSFLATLSPQEHFHFQFVQFIKDQLAEHKPMLIIIDSLEEMFKGFKFTETEAHGMFLLLQKLCSQFSCTLVIPRQSGMHERHYSTLGRAGTMVGEYILTLHWHPTQADFRVMTVAKNIKGPMGDQWHQRYFPDGRFMPFRMEPHQHVRPARSPATWQAEAARKSKKAEIIEVVKEKMTQDKVTAVTEIHAHLEELGYGEHTYRDAIAHMPVERIKKEDGHYHLVDKVEIDLMYHTTMHTHESRQAERVEQKKKQKKADADRVAAAQAGEAVPAKPEQMDTHTMRQAG